MMKLWEVIKALTEDPTKKFESKLSSRLMLRMSVTTAISRFFKFEVFYDTKLIDQSSDGGAFNGNVSLDYDWQPVKQPVPWQEAIQAWICGSKVTVVLGGDECIFEGFTEPEFVNHAINEGVWYVED